MSDAGQADPESRLYPGRPFVGVAGVVVSHNRVLLIRRGKEPSRGAWSLPGGVLELGEAIADAVVREVLEEAGIIVTPLELLEVVERVVKDDAGKVKYHYVLLDWLCRTDADAPRVLAGSDAEAAVWADVEALESFGLDALSLSVVKRGTRRAFTLGF